MEPDGREDGLRHGPLGPSALHLCIDMQELFARETPWHVPWAHRTAPSIRRLAEHRPEHTAFTRFLPPQRPEDMPGAWRRFYSRWAEMTRGAIDPVLLELVPMLAEFVPPALAFDKHGYSAFTAPRLGRWLRESGVDTLIVTGGETDVCVWATVIGAVDRGYRVVLAADAVCSTSDATHDALLQLCRSRFSQQIEVATVDQVLDAWR